MFFNSYNFLIFFVIVTFTYFAIPHRFRWLFLLLASYFFYMCWEPTYALLILTTTLIVYLTGLLMHNKTTWIKKLFVSISILSNLGILFLFKYYNFFIGSIEDLVNILGFKVQIPLVNVLLPVGISFYTFQALSYTIDIYRGSREPERHFGIFALYVSFFPQLVAGPIERSTRLLPQFYKKVEFDYRRIVEGLILMAWGFFQKLVIADRLGMYVNKIYGNPQAYDGLPLLVGTYFFVYQVFCDFSGYTDIAIGAAQVMGYELMPNFRRPYFSRNIAELWRKWHMSLIMWFRDYLYIPLGGNRVPRRQFYFNIILVFTLSGLWHGAQWTFVIWGAMNGVLIVLGRITMTTRDRVRESVIGIFKRISAGMFLAAGIVFVLIGILSSVAHIMIPGTVKVIFIIVGIASVSFAFVKFKKSNMDGFFNRAVIMWQVFLTFQLFALGAIFFRSRSISDAWYIVTHLPGTNIAQVLLAFDIYQFSLMVIVIIVLIVMHLIQEWHGSIRVKLREKPLWLRWALYFLLCSSILLFAYRGTAQFIYFQF